MSKEISLQAGQWYRNREGTICYCIGPLKRVENRFMIETANGLVDEYEANGIICKREEDFDDDDENYWKHLDLVEHLPGCDGFDWELPKPIEPPEGWRLLTEGETVLATDQWWEGRYWQDLSAGDFVVGGKWNGKDHYPMARKIEPKYRPFANAEEFTPHRNRWLISIGSQAISSGFERVISYDDHRVYVSLGECTHWWSYKDAMERFLFDDYTPFGVEVTQ